MIDQRLVLRSDLWGAFACRQRGIDRVLAWSISCQPGLFRHIEPRFRLRYRRLLYVWTLFYAMALGKDVDWVKSQHDLMALSEALKEEQGGR